MHPDAEQDTFHQGPSKEVEVGTARKLRISAELHQLFEGLDSRERTQLAHRIRQDVLENGVDLALVAPGTIEAAQEWG